LRAVRRGSLSFSNPTIATRYRLLRASCFRAEDNIRLLPERKLVYVMVPKAASTTIIQLLGGIYLRTAAGWPRAADRNFPTLAEIGPERLFAIIDDPDGFAFTFVRNPYTRLVSCYRNKFARFPVKVRSGVLRDVHRFFGSAMRKLDRSDPLPFDWFVEMAVATNRTGTDSHWLTMNTLLPDIPLHLIGRLEAFNTEFRQVADRAGIACVPQRVNVTGPHALGEWIDDSLRMKIYRGYRDDFERFGYAEALPE
jgi:hypothetical protein